MAGKTSALPACSVQRALLTLAALTLASFTFLSLRSLRSPPQYPSHPSSFSKSSRDVSVGGDPGGAGEASDLPSSQSIYHSPEALRRNYAEMERKLKVFIYPDGDPNTYYQTPRKLTGKYASEGYFFQNIRDSQFRTDDPDQADLFFIPISPHKMRGKAFI